MAILIGDYVLITEGSASATMATSLNQIIQATSGNLTHLQSLVDAGLAQGILSGPAKKYKALLSQSGTAAPTATVRRNTLSGTPTWARTSEGVYTCTLTSEWTANKTVAEATVIALGTGNEFQTDIARTSANVLTLTVRDFGGNVVDGFSGIVDIEVYA